MRNTLLFVVAILLLQSLPIFAQVTPGTVGVTGLGAGTTTTTHIANLTFSPQGMPSLDNIEFSLKIHGDLSTDFPPFFSSPFDGLSYTFQGDIMTINGTIPPSNQTTIPIGNITIGTNMSGDPEACVAVEGFSVNNDPGVTITPNFLSNCNPPEAEDCGKVSMAPIVVPGNDGTFNIPVNFLAGSDMSLFATPEQNMTVKVVYADNVVIDESNTSSQSPFATIQFGDHEIEITTLHHAAFEPEMARIYFTKANPAECISLEIAEANTFQNDEITCSLQIEPGLTSDCTIGGKVTPVMGDTKLNDLEITILDDLNGPDFTESVQENIYLHNAAEDGDFSINVDLDSSPDDDLCGVSTADILFISRAILGLQAFDSNWKFIAADVTGEGNVTIADIIEIRRLILGLSHAIDEPWVYPLDEDYGFLSNTENPLGDIFYDVVATGVAVQQNRFSNTDFLAIKLGDINGNCYSYFEEDAPGEAPMSSQSLVTQIQNHPLKKGQTYKIPISIQNFDRLSVLDFAFSYDNKAIKLNTISSGDLVMQDGVTHNINQEEGTVRGIWLPESMEVAQARPTDPNHFYVEFTALQDVARLAQVFELQEGATNNRIYPLALPTPAERKTEGMKSADAPSQINWIEASNSTVTTVGAETSLHLLSPNPFTNQLDFSITSPAAQTGSLQLYSFTGQRVAAQPVRLVTGSNRVSLRKLEALPPGAYAYRLVTEQGTTLAGVVIK